MSDAKSQMHPSIISGIWVYLPYGWGAIVRRSADGEEAARVAIDNTGRLRINNQRSPDSGLDWPPNYAATGVREDMGTWRSAPKPDGQPILNLVCLDRNDRSFKFSVCDGYQVTPESFMPAEETGLFSKPK